MSIYNTLSFLMISRKAIAEAIRKSKVNENKQQSISYVLNEASDYEIISLLTENKLPEEKYNIQHEQELWNKFKYSIVSNYKGMSKSINPNILSSVLEMGAISHKGYSSMKPIVEFHLNNGRFDKHTLQEADAEELISRWLGPQPPSSDMKLFSAWKQASIAMKKIAPWMNSEDKNKSRAFTVARTPILKFYKAAKQGSPDADLLQQDMMKSMHNATQIAKSAAASAVAPISQAISNPTVTKTAATVVRTSPDLPAGKTMDDPTGGIKAATGTATAGGISGKLAAFKAAMAPKVAMLAPYAPYLAGAALAALVMYAGYKTYKRFFSMAAKACSSKSGSEKTECMKKFQSDAYNEQIKQLETGISACTKSKDPAKCKMQIASKITKLKKKKAKLSENYVYDLVDKILI